MMGTPALLTKLAGDWPPEQWRDVTVLVAVSGGADSVALLRGLCALRSAGDGRLVIAHFNHRLRGAESAADQTFVEELGQQQALRVILGSRDGDGRASSEETLREQRYQFLRQAADQAGARYVAIAHTADDQVETVLHNILRGTGLAGLAGIPRVRPLTEAATLIRPLLGATRAEVLAFLD
jgi:tRNA(Ile)-lysidine synthase